LILAVHNACSCLPVSLAAQRLLSKTLCIDTSEPNNNVRDKKSRASKSDSNSKGNSDSSKGKDSDSKESDSKGNNSANKTKEPSDKTADVKNKDNQDQKKTNTEMVAMEALTKETSDTGGSTIVPVVSIEMSEPQASNSQAEAKGQG